MALSDTKLRTLKPRAQKFSESDSGGLFIEVTPSGRDWCVATRAKVDAPKR